MTTRPLGEMAVPEPDDWVETRWKYDSRCEVTTEDHERGEACHPLTPHSHRPGATIKWARPFPIERKQAATPLDPGPLYVPDSHAVLLARARRAKRAQWTAFCCGIAFGAVGMWAVLR